MATVPQNPISVDSIWQNSVSVFYRTPQEPPERLMNPLSEQQIETIRAEHLARGKIAAVKMYKDWTGCSLMEAKTAVEAMEHVEEVSPPMPPQALSGRLRTVSSAVERVY